MKNPYPTPRKKQKTIKRKNSTGSTGSSAMRELANAISPIISRAVAGRKRMVRGKKFKSFKKGRKRKAGKYSLSGVRLKRVTYDKFQKYGNKIISETSGNITTEHTAAPTYNKAQFAVVGHCSTVPITGMLSVANALVKLLAIRMNQPITSFSNIIRDFTVNDQIYLLWQANASSATTSTNLGVAVGWTWNQVASTLAGVFEGSINEEAELLELGYIPVNTSLNPLVRIDLMQTFIKMKVWSVLKVQNVSLPADAGDDTADEVTAIALHGTSVTGRGGGTALVRPRSQFLTDIGLWGRGDVTENGIILRRYNLDTQILSDIPRPQELLNVKKHGKILMGPGQIQMSKLYDYYDYKVTTIIKKLKEGMDQTTERVKSPSLGSYAIHFLQKIIEVASPNTTPISLNWQLDNTYESYATTSTFFPTTQAVVLDGSLVQ